MKFGKYLLLFFPILSYSSFFNFLGDLNENLLDCLNEKHVFKSLFCV